MTVLVHLLLFVLSAGVVWFFAGMLIESVNNVAKRFHQSGFTVAFFVLGFLTSISEISVMVNSSINQTPQISAGNLVGASFVILLFIVPLLAIVGKGVQLRNTLRHKYLAIALFAVALPALLMLDGSVSRSEGVMCFLLYGTLIYFIRKEHSKSAPEIVVAVSEELIDRKKATAKDVIKIVIGAAFIFISGHLLVDEAGYFSQVLSIPSSIIGLVLLSIGTNIPELVIAVRSVLKKHKDIAFGDYLGSTVTNTLVFAFLPWINGKFSVEPSEFIDAAVLMVIGLVGFFFFAKSKNKITRREGFALIAVYGAFLVIQAINLVRFATD